MKNAENGISNVFVPSRGMNDAYQGYLHPERASIHGKSGKNFKKGDRSTHDEGEMRVIPEEGHNLSYYKELIPFLTDQYDPGTIKAVVAKDMSLPQRSCVPTSSMWIIYSV